MATSLVLVHALSPLHAGTGQAIGAIDLPIARERPTGIPLVPGSSIKGALRARAWDDNDVPKRDLAKVIFGPETNGASEHAGAVQFGDAHTILLPVRSLAGTFAWTTSPYLLSRLARDANEAGCALPVPPRPKAEGCLVLGNRLVVAPRVILEDLDLVAKIEGDDSPLAEYARSLARWLFPAADEKKVDPATAAARSDFRERLCVVDDDMMSFLLDSATEVAARVRLDPEKKTVARGALWTEESLPTETVLCGLAVASRATRNGTIWDPLDLLQKIQGLANGLVQLGGKANVGRGSCRVRFAGGAK